MTICQIDTYLYARMESWNIFDKKRKQHPPQRDDAGTAEGATCRVGRGEQGEARPAISAPRDGPHLDLGRLRLKPLSRSDFSIAGTTWRTSSSMCFIMKPTNSPTQGQPNPKNNRLKVEFGPLFPTAKQFLVGGIDFI